MTNNEKIELAEIIIELMEGRASLSLAWVFTYERRGRGPCGSENMQVSLLPVTGPGIGSNNQELLPALRFIVETFRKQEEIRLADRVGNLEVPCA